MALSALVFVPAILFGQSDLKVQVATLSVGEPVSGKLAILPGTLVFVDDGKPEASFSIARENVQSISANGETATIQLAKAVKDRSGTSTRVILRFTTAGEATDLQRWQGSAMSAGTAGASADAKTFTYSAQRKKRFRSNTDGKFIIDGERVIFESTENASESRRWEMKEIREFKMKNLFEVEVTNSTDEKYTLTLSGQGMDSSEYRDIADRIAKARTAR